jgi:hypothetical protein
MAEENQVSSSNNKPTQDANLKGRITPELVRRVAERVYNMLRQELLIERERARTRSAVRPGGFRR